MQNSLHSGWLASVSGLGQAGWGWSGNQAAKEGKAGASLLKQNAYPSDAELAGI